MVSLHRPLLQRAIKKAGDYPEEAQHRVFGSVLELLSNLRERIANTPILELDPDSVVGFDPSTTELRDDHLAEKRAKGLCDSVGRFLV
jgi:hypothetical protein